MLPILLIYNAVMLLADWRALRFVRARPGFVACTQAFIGGGLVAFMLALLLGGGGFFSVRLLSWGIFLHGAIGLAGCVVVLRGKPGLRALALVLLLALEAICAWAFLIEPFRLEVNHHVVESTRVDAPLRIAVLADIQTDDVGEHERRALTEAMAAEPDLILLPGDYIHTPDRKLRDEQRAALRELMAEVGLDAPLGVFATRGNCEPAQSGWEEIFAGLPITVASDTQRYELDDAPITITALGLMDSFRPGIRVELPAREGDLHIVVGHGPDFARGQVFADLLIAGHTHGGQVRIPGFGPPLTLSTVPRDWAAGRTELERGSTLIVSRGVGMERNEAPRLRFLCPPEVVIVDVVPVAQP